MKIYTILTAPKGFSTYSNIDDNRHSQVRSRYYFDRDAAKYDYLALKGILGERYDVKLIELEGNIIEVKNR